MKITPVKASLKGQAYFFFNGSGKYTPDISYSYAFNDATTPTKITDVSDPSTITAPSGAKTLQLDQTGYIDPQWTGGDSNVKIDSNGKITGLDNPAEAGKTVTFKVTHGIDSTITHTFNVKIPAKSNPTPTPNNNGASSSNNSTAPANPTNNAWNPTTPPKADVALAYQITPPLKVQLYTQPSEFTCTATPTSRNRNELPLIQRQNGSTDQCLSS